MDTHQLSIWAEHGLVGVVMFSIQILEEENSGVVPSWAGTWTSGSHLSWTRETKSGTIAGSIKDTGRHLQTSRNGCSGC